ncbi:hypothetical protein [Alysiella filiformis]|nr:hypothetical protein [Alysiella filiformis]QMT31354.1 hypothetical protein H3L97_00050 [Alysiella filiformis]UBQ55638.1 hypothetical protein JF568_08615 [Alysiella filiformis DSM 16848]
MNFRLPENPSGRQNVGCVLRTKIVEYSANSVRGTHPTKWRKIISGSLKI